MTAPGIITAAADLLCWAWGHQAADLPMPLGTSPAQLSMPWARDRVPTGCMQGRLSPERVSAVTSQPPLPPTLWAHAPCEEHAGVHDGSPQDGDRGVLCLQFILLDAREADGEVLPLVEHCREAEVRAGSHFSSWLPVAVGALTSLWGTAGQCRESEVHHVAADD